MPKLRQTTTGEIFPFMPTLAARPDMEIIDDVPAPAPVQDTAAEDKKRAAKPKKDFTPTSVEAD